MFGICNHALTTKSSSVTPYTGRATRGFGNPLPDAHPKPGKQAKRHHVHRPKYAATDDLKTRWGYIDNFVLLPHTRNGTESHEKTSHVRQASQACREKMGVVAAKDTEAT